MGIEARALAFLLSLMSLFTRATVDLLPDLTDKTSILALVNRRYTLTRDFEPESLVLPAVRIAADKEKHTQLRPEAATALEALFAAALADGHTLYAVSGYRSYASQSALFRDKVNRSGEKEAMLLVAQPGTSEHQLGLVMDVNGETTLKDGLEENFAASPEGRWIAENAHLFGFIIRYPRDKTDITGYSWEPWHLRYVGVEAAGEIFALNITLEEYHALLWEQSAQAWATKGE